MHGFKKEIGRFHGGEVYGWPLARAMVVWTSMSRGGKSLNGSCIGLEDKSREGLLPCDFLTASGWVTL